MTQNINLFNPAFRKERALASSVTAAKLFGLTLLLLVAFHAYLRYEVGSLAEELQAAESMLKEQRAMVDKLKGVAATRKPDADVEAEITRLEVELRESREAMNALKGGVFGNQEGFSEYLRAFSRQTVNGLWLTGFTIAGTGEIEIRGRVVSPDLVASYIQRLNREAVLQGRSFARFEMTRPKPEPAAGKDKDTPRPPRFLEFSLATTDAAKPERAP